MLNLPLGNAMRLLLTLLGICLGFTCAASIAAHPPLPRLLGNLYMISLVAPDQVAVAGFPGSSLSDNLVRFVQGTPPTVDAAGVPAFYIAFEAFYAAAIIAAQHATASRSVYVYSIAGNPDWYRVSQSMRDLAQGSAAFQLISHAFASRNIWHHRGAIIPEDISYSVEFRGRQSFAPRLFNPRDGVLQPFHRYFEAHTDQDPNEFIHLLRGGSTLLSMDPICNATRQQRYTAMVLTANEDTCDAQNRLQLSQRRYIAYQLFPVLLGMSGH